MAAKRRRSRWARSRAGEGTRVMRMTRRCPTNAPAGRGWPDGRPGSAEASMTSVARRRLSSYRCRLPQSFSFPTRTTSPHGAPDPTPKTPRFRSPPRQNVGEDVARGLAPVGFLRVLQARAHRIHRGFWGFAPRCRKPRARGDRAPRPVDASRCAATARPRPPARRRARTTGPRRARARRRARSAGHRRAPRPQAPAPR